MSTRNIEKSQRNAVIRAMHADGISQKVIAEKMDISPSRVHQIINKIIKAYAFKNGEKEKI